jgi:phage regulator Rha-like protein
MQLQTTTSTKIAQALGLTCAPKHVTQKLAGLGLHAIEPHTRPLRYDLDAARAVVETQGGDVSVLGGAVAALEPVAIEALVVDGEPRVSSREVAAALGVKHQNLFELVKQHEADFVTFGDIRFETEKLPPGSGAGRPTQHAMLNEDQAYLLLTYSRNTPQARACKIALVAAFKRLRGQARQLPAAPMPSANSLDVLRHIVNQFEQQAAAISTVQAATAEIERQQAATVVELERLESEKAALEQRLSVQEKVNDRLSASPQHANWVRATVVELGRVLTERGQKPPSHGKWYPLLYRQLNDAFNVNAYLSLPLSRFGEVQDHLKRAYRTHNVAWPEDVFAQS